MIHHAGLQLHEGKLKPGLWRYETLMIAPWKILIFACPKCGFRGPAKVESKEPFEYSCFDRKCGYREYVALDGWEPVAGLEKPGKAEGLGV